MITEFKQVLLFLAALICLLARALPDIAPQRFNWEAGPHFFLAFVIFIAWADIAGMVGR